jgi:hypothetical protein
MALPPPAPLPAQSMLLTGAVLLCCSRAPSSSEDPRAETFTTANVWSRTDPPTTGSSHTRAGDSSKTVTSACLGFGNLPNLQLNNLHWIEQVKPTECVYDGKFLFPSRVCAERGRSEICEHEWPAGLGQLYRLSNVRFALESPPQWVLDISRTPHVPCHHDDGQPYFERFVVLGVGQEIVPVLFNREKVHCPWRHGQTLDRDVPKSEAIRTDSGKPRDVMCWPVCAEWVWREHETVIVRPDNEGVHLVAYQPKANTR